MALLFLGGLDKYGGVNSNASSVAGLLMAGEWTTVTGSGGTIVAGTITPTFATASGTVVPCAVGDVLRVVGPASPDATFANFYCSLVG